MYPPAGPPTGLDAPPPSPATLGIGTGASPSQGGYSGLAPTGITPDMLQQALQMGQQCDQALTGFASVFPAGAAEFRQAQQLMQLGFAKAMQSASGPPATSSTATGSQFPGGGFSGGLP